MIAEIWDIKILKDFVHYYSLYRISGNDGRGRKDIVEIVKRQLEKRITMETENLNVKR